MHQIFLFFKRKNENKEAFTVISLLLQYLFENEKIEDWSNYCYNDDFLEKELNPTLLEKKTNIDQAIQVNFYIFFEMI